MTMKTSACGWQAAGDKTAREGTAATCPWRETGYKYAYQWNFARAVSEIAHRAAEFKGYLPRAEQPFVFVSEQGYPHTLSDLVCTYQFIKTAIDVTSLKGNAPGPDGKTFYLEYQLNDLGESQIRKLKHSLRSGTYRPGGWRAVRIKTGSKTRTLHIPNVQDRVVERDIASVLTPLAEPAFHPSSYGFRQGICIADAIRGFASAVLQHKRYVVGKIDLKDAFDRIPQARLLDIVGLHVPDAKLLELIKLVVTGRGWENKQGKTKVGLPQGGPMSPLLFNIYLNHVFDQCMGKHGVKFIRWADDIVLICESASELQAQRALIERILNGAGLAVNREKTFSPGATANLLEGECLEFLGMRVGLDDSKTNIVLSLTEDALSSLQAQLLLVINGQRPNVTWSGRRTFITDQVKMVIAGWLEAFSGAIPCHDWPTLRKEIKGWFLSESGSSPWILEQCQAKHEHLPVDCPSTECLNGLYERAATHWQARMARSTPEVIDRLVGRGERDANSKTSTRQLVPDDLSDGADLVPAPSAFIHAAGDRKPGADLVDFRLELAEAPF